MRCPKGIELERVHDDALRNYEESLNANWTGVTMDWIRSDILDKAVGVQIASTHCPTTLPHVRSVGATPKDDCRPLPSRLGSSAGATLRPNTSNADVIRVFHPIPFDSYFEAMRSYTTGSLSLVKAMLDYDEQLRVIRAYCKHTQKLSFTIRLDPAGQPKERKCVTLTFCCEECGAVREFVGDHVKVTDEECAMRGLVAEDSGWQVSREPT